MLINHQEINISHLGKRKIIFKMDFSGDMLIPWRVLITYKSRDDPPRKPTLALAKLPTPTWPLPRWHPYDGPPLIGAPFGNMVALCWNERIAPENRWLEDEAFPFRRFFFLRLVVQSRNALFIFQIGLPFFSSNQTSSKTSHHVSMAERAALALFLNRV